MLTGPMSSFLNTGSLLQEIRGWRIIGSERECSVCLYKDNINSIIMEIKHADHHYTASYW